MNKKILYFDMDGVIVDFDSAVAKLTEYEKKEFFGRYDEVPNIFKKMEPMKGAIESVKYLAQYFDVYILSTSPWANNTALQDKLDWIKKYFGDDEDSIFYKKVIFSANKHLNLGDYLIDDRDKNGADKFQGKHIKFGSEKFSDWKSVVEYLKEIEKID